MIEGSDCSDKLTTADHRHRWRHVKRGTVYIEIGRGCFQTAQAEYLDDQEVVIYQAETGGVTWVRPTYEFMDGRFVREDDMRDKSVMNNPADNKTTIGLPPIGPCATCGDEIKYGDAYTVITGGRRHSVCTTETRPTTKPRTLNKRRHGVPDGATYVGRPSMWGNPFEIGRDGTRAEVIAKHRAWLCDQPKLLAELPRLRGRDLVCWCAPAACHADTLREMANAG